MPKHRTSLIVALVLVLTGVMFAQDVTVTTHAFTDGQVAQSGHPRVPVLDTCEGKTALLQHVSKTRNSEGPHIMPNGVSVPGDFPHVDVAVNKETADGYIFINNWSDASPYNIIFDNAGSPVWYERQMPGDRRRDFKMQKDGSITMLTRQWPPHYAGYDANFNPTKNYSAAEPYFTDEHELQVLENGNYLIIGIRDTTVDWSERVPGGKSAVTVLESAIQEFTADGELIMTWAGLDYFDPNDIYDYCTLNEANPKSSFIRFPHMNAIDIDDDGHILLSSRHLSEVTKIHRETGEIIWRLGGANNQFEFINDELGGFYMQHDIRALGHNRYTIFDNGNLHEPKQSRAVEYVLDTENMTATLVWEFRGTEDNNFYTHYMGNAQRLPNGNTLVNFVRGSNPKAMEVTPDGEVVYEMNFADKYDTYRAFRFPWNGVVESPRLLMEQDIGKITLLFNKFGDKNVEYYNIYSGTEPEPATRLDSSKVTMKTLTGLENMTRHFFRVTAVYSDGTESEYSNELNTFVKNLEPGQNMVINGDFSAGLDQWWFGPEETGAAPIVTAGGECHIEITNGGNKIYDVFLVQDGMPLVKGKDYRFEFDAYADENRTIVPQIIGTDGPMANYSRTSVTKVARAKKHYAFDFNMSRPSDPNALLVFLLGGSNADVYIDNVSISEVTQNDVNDFTEDQAPTDFELLPAFPNPFNASTVIKYTLPRDAHVSLTVYSVRGRVIRRLVDQHKKAGSYAVTLSATEFPSGLYFYQLQAGSFTRVRKMMKIK